MLAELTCPEGYGRVKFSDAVYQIQTKIMHPEKCPITGVSRCIDCEPSSIIKTGEKSKKKKGGERDNG